MDPQNQPRPRTTAADFFLHLGVIVGLYISVISFLNLLFNLISYVFPNKPLSYGVSTDSISVPVSLLIIFVPIYIFLSWIMNRSYEKDPSKRGLWVRKWLVYLTLFITGLAIAIDLFVLVQYFLRGELITIGFILKVFAVLLVLAAVFGYHLADIRDRVDPKKNKLYAWIVALVVLVSIVLGFVVIGSPAKQRHLRVDQQKVYDLQNIQSQILSYWQAKQTLPSRLEDVADSLSYFTLPLDPETKANYEYVVVGPLSFQLCANFNLPTDTRFSRDMYYYESGPGTKEDNWTHEAGRHCFDRTIDPDRYPPLEKTLLR